MSDVNNSDFDLSECLMLEVTLEVKFYTTRPVLLFKSCQPLQLYISSTQRDKETSTHRVACFSAPAICFYAHVPHCNLVAILRRPSPALP